MALIQAPEIIKRQMAGLPLTGGYRPQPVPYADPKTANLLKTQIASQAAAAPQPAGTPEPLPAPGPAPAPQPAAPGSVPTLPNAAPPNQMDEATQRAIMSLLNTKRGIDPGALYNSPEMRAVRFGGQRAEERGRAQLAERAAVTGTDDSGGFETDLAGLRETRGLNETTEMGRLATIETERQRQDLTQGIQFAMATQQFGLAQQLQRELAQLDAQVAREGRAESGRQFDAGLGFNYAQLEQDANARALMALLGLVR